MAKKEIIKLFNKKYAIRIVHSIFVAVFLVCIIRLYHYALEDVFDNGLYVISSILFCEAVALILNGGRCPLEHVHRKVGDDKGFFDHFFPAPMVPYVIPVVVVFTGIGFLLLYL
jgi:hypothetical protein